MSRMLLSQMKDGGGLVVVAREPNGPARIVKGAQSVYALAMKAADQGARLAKVIADHGFGETIDLARAYEAGRLMAPITHPHPANLHLTGTGLTHLGSAATR